LIDTSSFLGNDSKWVVTQQRGGNILYPHWRTCPSARCCILRVFILVSCRRQKA